MNGWRTSITASKAIVLSREVVCDGFHRNTSNRVQTHVHTDHMGDFQRSIGLQRVLTLPPTKELLISELDGTLDIRSNFVAASSGVQVSTERGKLVLLENGHMLGSAQVFHQHQDGYRTGYSGDFPWPCDNIIKVDELVLDSTYGNPDSIRRYSQEEADDMLAQAVSMHIANGPVYIYAWRGTLQRAMVILGNLTQFPIIVEERQARELDIYRRYGVGIPAVLVEGSEAAKSAMSEGRFILVGGRGGRLYIDRPAGYTITLSVRMVHSTLPILETSPSSCEIALSDHADFEGTLEYASQTGAQRVLTDNSRGPNGIALALAISDRLGVDARPGGEVGGFGAREWGA